MSDLAPFIQHLHHLAHQQDRAALATLRRGLARAPGAEPACYPLVVPFIPEPDNRPGRDWPYFLVASLFALHPTTGARGDLGWTCLQLGKHPSAALRFRRLLAADERTLPTHLRQVVGLARSSKTAAPIDWGAALKHLRHWDHPDRWVQRRWARSYWTDAPETTATPATSEEPS